ncbi:type VI secretion system tip protein VgrG [Pseudoduganella sp. DS3]|uniref:Type VI secretion system tip protein VgrG n=1 Tax=Pseudoduganella guangdongensis TaxID=2692179 RepID=A0A6N9HMT2_9BURK|nr:type VI secretion system Vgr family protein [Pseudoduganella guangdongensis]MYN04820.1 type VI secretion system tip protein VgrG [Pseudoduganella guangdongensis]
MASDQLAGLISGLIQNRRILQLHTPASAPDAVKRLVPLQVAGQEAVCGGFQYRLQCLSNDDQLPLKKLQGLPLAFAIGDDSGEARPVCGIVSRAECVLSDGALTVYELVLRDALSLLAQRSTWRVFRDASVLDISNQILSEHIQQNQVLGAAFQFSLSGASKSYPPRSFTLQAGESDADFLTRLWRQEGIAWHFDHKLDDGRPLHRLCLIDSTEAYPDNPAGTVRFHRADATEQRDTVVAWQAWREQAPGEARRSSFDYKSVNTTEAQAPDMLEQGDAGSRLSETLTDYQYDAARFGAGSGHYEQQARSRMLAHEYLSKGFSGESVVRQFRSGTVFNLSQHAEIDSHPESERAFILTRLELYARNGMRLDAKLARSLFRGWPQAMRGADGHQSNEAPVYYNQFDCVRRSIPVVPHYDPASVPQVGMLSAIVVGAEGSEIDVDEMGRIAVRFLFARPEEHAKGAGASGTPRDSARIRVLQPWADAGFGTAFWPRVGSEILVGFIQGHPDKPIALGGLYDGTHDTPRFNGFGSLPANAALYGMRTKELKAQRHNQLRFDDTNAQISTQILSEHAATQLNQGWLGTPRSEGKSSPRGEGFELATDAAGALRAAKGMLVTAFERLNANGKQLDRSETLSMMEECLGLFKALGKYSAEHQGQAADNEPQAKLHTDLQQWEQGSNTEPGGAGGRQPVIALTAPAGLVFNTPKAAVTHAGENIDQVALKNMQLASGERTVVNAGKGISMFSQSEDFKLIAHQGKWLAQAQHNDVQVDAAKNIKLSASGGKVQVIASEEIMLVTSDGTFIKLGGGKITMGCNDAATIHAATHHWTSPATESAELPKFDKGDVGRVPQLINPLTKKGIPGMRYEITRSDGSILKGVTDAEGRAAKIDHDAFEGMKVRFFDAEN